jgi:hypothetical protein
MWVGGVGKPLDISLSSTDGNHLAVEGVEELCQFFLCLFYDIGYLDVIDGTNDGAAGETLDEAEFLPIFVGHRYRLKLVVLAIRAS